MPIRARSFRIARLAFVSGALSLFAGACSGQIDPGPMDPRPAPGAVVAPEGSAPPDVSLALIRTGELETTKALVVAGGSWFEDQRMAHIAVLVRHPRGDLLIDTGLGEHRDEHFAAMPWWVRPSMAYRPHPTARAQLAEAGIDPDGIERILLTHLHWDHASGVEDFPDAEVWVGAAELDWARGEGAEEPGVVPEQFDAPSIDWRRIRFDAGPHAGFEASADLFGDGSVVAVPVPGHTPGSVAVFVTTGSSRRFLFTGDTTWCIEGFLWPAHKHWLSSWLVDVDPERLEGSIVAVHQRIAADPELEVVPAHDRAVQEAIGYFPELIR